MPPHATVRFPVHGILQPRATGPIPAVVEGAAVVLVGGVFDP